ncbi:TPA: carboxymuconolactone decarboxylase family protein [Candidatus Bathyarchaeota archaeon]|nr:carboxymuconolactone decarboxylase family protein [Candidatus Bathyarchaeota archaeon]
MLGKKVSRKISEKIGFEPGPAAVFVKLDPTSAAFYEQCDKVILSDGALSAKYKMLLVMCISATRMCDDCVTQSMKAALNLGATREEILEALRVTFVTSGAQTVQVAKKALETILAKAR